MYTTEMFRLIYFICQRRYTEQPWNFVKKVPSNFGSLNVNKWLSSRRVTKKRSVSTEDPIGLIVGYVFCYNDNV